MAQNADIDALLAKLRQSQPLAMKPTGFPDPTQQVQNQVRDSVIENIRRAPTLADSLNQVAQGGKSPNSALGVVGKVFSNPIVKTALYPLTVADTARRGVISGVREITDLLDDDPNTKASWSDFGKQAADTTYGFGTAFPMEGWGGRMVGFAGDVLLDPLTWPTLGSAVSAKAVLRGTNISTRLALGGAERTGLAAKVFGATKPVRFITPEGRNSLARLFSSQQRHINLLDDVERSALGLFKRSESEIQTIEQAIAKWGKTRVPVDIARDIGLPKAGIYYFGSRVKVPFSGTIGKMLEHGLAGARTKITSKTTGSIARLMESMVPEGVVSDAINVKDMRRALITGKATPDQASTYLKLLGDNQQRRVIENITKEAYTSSFNQRIANNPLVVEHSKIINELIENPELYAAATLPQQQATDIVRAWGKEMHTNIESNLKRIDPSMPPLAEVKNYFPHQMTEKALEYADDLRNPFVEQLRVYLKRDVTDPSSAFIGRHIKERPFFGVMLTDEDIAGGVKTLNRIAREKGGIEFDFFETDAIKVFAKYGDSYASEIAKAHFFERQLDGGILKMMQATGNYDTEFLDSLQDAVKDSLKNVTSGSKSVSKTAGALRQNINEALETFGTATKKTTVKLKGAARAASKDVTVARKSLADTKRAIDTLVEALQKTGMKDVQERFNKFGLNGIMVDSQIDGPLDNIVQQIEQISTYMRIFNDSLSNGTKSVNDFVKELDVLNSFATKLEQEAGSFHTQINEFESIHNVLGEFINGKFSQLAMDNAEEGGGAGLEKVVRIIKNQSLRDQVGLSEGKIAKNKVVATWGKTTAINDPRVAALKTLLDPNNKVTQTSLQNLTIENVRDILSRSVIKASSLTELRDAMVWMVIRDIDRSPSLLDSILLKEIIPSTGNNLDSLVNNNGTVSRIAKMKETIEQINNLDNIINNSARDASKTKGGISYGVEQIVDGETQIRFIDGKIAQAKIDLAILQGTPDVVPLREWRRVASGKENQIVQNAREIEDLFNSIKSNPQKIGLGVYSTEIDDFESLFITEFKNAGLERGQLTYGDVTNYLESYVDQILETPESVLRFGKEIGESRQQITDLQNLRATTLKDINKRAPSIDNTSKNYIASVMDSSTYAETVLEHSNQALEYYLYSEAKTQFNYLMDELAPWGIKPSYGVYQRILGDVAHSHIVNVDAFTEQVETVGKLFKKIEEEVANQSASQQGTHLRGILQRELNDEVNGPLIDAVFPEVRASVSKTKLTDFSRRQARDETIVAYSDGLVSLLGEYRSNPNVSQGIVKLIDEISSNKNNVNILTTIAKVKRFLTDTNKMISPSEAAGAFANKQVLKANLPEADVIRIADHIAKIEPEIIQRLEILKAEQASAKALNKAAGLATSTRKAGAQTVKLKQLSKGNYNYGLVGSLQLALDASSSNRIKAFFSSLHGGMTIDYASGQVYTGVAKTARQETNQLRHFKIVNPENSLIGTIKSKLYERKAALRATTDLDYNVAGLVDAGSVVPGLTVSKRAARSTMGVKAYAELLSERAAELQATILGNEEYAAHIRALRKQVDTLGDSDVAVEYQILELLKQENVVSSGGALYRIKPQTDISALPKSIQKEVIESRKLKIRSEKLMQTDEFLAARHEQNLNAVLHELADIDGWRIVDVNGESGLFFEQSGLNGRRIWNAPRQGSTDASNIDDIAVQQFIAGQPEYLFDNPALRFTKSGTVGSQPNPLYGRTPKMGDYTVRNMEEIPFNPSAAEWDSPNYHYLIQEQNVYRKVTQADIELMSPEQVRQIRALRFKPNLRYANSKKWLRAGIPDFESKLGNNDGYVPSETWIQLRAESEVVGPAKTASEGVVTKSAKPEVWLPHNDVIPSQQSTSLLDTNFTASEWEALFVPGPITEKGKLQELRALVDKHNQTRVRFADLSRSAKTRAEKTSLLAKFDSADRAYQKATAELNLYKSRTTARVKLNRLVEQFEDPEVAKGLGVPLSEGKQANPADTARAFVKRQLGGKGDDGVPVNADSGRKGVIKARRTRVQQGWKESEHYPIIKELDTIHKETNSIAFKQYAKSVKQQYQAYVDVLDELKVTTNSWTKDQATVQNAKLISGILENPTVSSIVQPARQLSPTEISDASEQEIKRLLASGDAKSETEALAMIDAHNANLEATAATVRDTANALDQAGPQTALEVTDAAPSIRANLVSGEQTSLRLAEETKEMIKDLEFDKLLKTRSVESLTEAIKTMTKQERLLLSAKAKRLTELAAIDEKRLSLINTALKKVNVKASSNDPVEQLMQLAQAHRVSISSFDLAKNLERNALGAIDDSEAMLDIISDIAGRAKNFKNISSKELDWIPEFEAWRDEAVPLLEMLSKNNNVSVKTKAMLTTYVDAVNSLELSRASLGAAQSALAAERGIKMMFDETGIGANMLIKELEKGYEFLNKDTMPNVMVKSAYAEILRNGNKFREPLVGASLDRVLRKWNSYWKPLATTTPGFHVRNNLNNIMAMVFGGASPFNLREATEVTTLWYSAARSNSSWDEFVRTLTPKQQVHANAAHWAVAATGGGVYSDVPMMDNFVQRFKPIAASRKFGYDADSFARFVFSYEASMQGFSPEQAAMRTKRFYIDYEDVSSLDKTMRQIVPFWMWTSRNVVTQVQNMWLNPKPYAIYNSFKRNFQDKNDDNAVSKSWTELGAFKLPFGKDLYAMPDLGFTKVQQQLDMAQNPSRFLSDVNPLLRVPAELLTNTKVYNQRKFKDEPVQVSGVGLGSILQPLAQLLGMGETNSRGQRFIDEKALYGLTSMLPPAGISERIMPSTGSEAGGWNANSIAGFFGSPVKQLTPKMEQSELLRRLFEIQKISSRNQAVNNPQG